MTINENLSSWDNYSSGTFLKASNVKSEDTPFICISVEETEEKKVRLNLESENVDYMFDLNITNIKKLKELKVTSPKSLIGKKIFFKKVLAMNPKIKQEVDSLRISRIE